MQSPLNAAIAENIHQEQQESLAAAFAFFNETSEQLALSYKMLEGRVQQLSEELDRAAEEKAQANASQQKIASRMEALLNFLPGGVIVLDAKGNVLDANPAAIELLGTELMGRLWRDAITECFAPKNDDGLEISTKSGKRISIATSSLGNDGQILLLTDQTETRKLQENLSRYEKLSAMGKMVSALAHQIRTPLSAAILYAGHLCNKNLSTDNKDKFSHKLYGRLQHMEKQVRDMMLFVKSELPLNDIISLADLEIGLREASEVALSTSNAVCEWRNTYPNKKIKCHREALISALMNLINNSIQASNEMPELIIELGVGDVSCTDVGNPCVQIKIMDKGQGIADKDIQKSQELFVTTKAQGTGLGLSVVASVARAHGGNFLLESTLGEGTVASIVVPLFSVNNHSNPAV